MCGDTFSISVKWENRTYIGLKKDVTIIIDADSEQELESHDISFINIGLPEYLKKSALMLSIEAAEQGNVEEQCKLGYMYEYGEGVSQDYEEAAKWYRKAAEQGSARGQYNLGHMYDNGKGVSQKSCNAVVGTSTSKPKKDNIT